MAEALTPSAVNACEAAGELRIILTLIKHAENLAHLAGTRGAKLTALPNPQASDFHFGTPATGVLIRPVDESGTHLDLAGVSNFAAVYSIAILAVGLSLKEARR